MRLQLIACPKLFGESGILTLAVIFLLLFRLAGPGFHTHDVRSESTVSQSVDCPACDLEATSAIGGEPAAITPVRTFEYATRDVRPEKPLFPLFRVALDDRGPPSL